MKAKSQQKHKSAEGNASVVSGADSTESGDCLVVFASCVASHNE